MSSDTASVFTAQQQAAIDARRGSGLLAASAGSGKTRVLVERFAEAVLADGVRVSEILAITFTEKAAAELRDRVRARLLERGAVEEARALENAWIGTIHGFCARLLGFQALAAGLDPRFKVLDEPGARRLAERAFEQALEEWAADEGSAALDVAAAYGPELRDIVLSAHAALRSRGQTRPRLSVPPRRPAPRAERAALEAARAAALAVLEAATPGKRVDAGLEALESCAALTPGDAVAPWALDDAELKRGAKALDHDDCVAYRDAWKAYRQACADYHAQPVVELVDRLLARFGERYAALKAERSGVDFEDLELGVRDLLAGDEALRRRWSERFRLIMVDEFQDTNRLQLEILHLIAAGNDFAVGDEFQSIYSFRFADVEVFRERRAALPEATKELTVNFRSAPEILDVVNHAFEQLFDGFPPLQSEAARDGRPKVELALTADGAWDDAPVGLADVSATPGRRAEARALAHRLREEVEGGRGPGDIVVLVRATASLALFEEALAEQDLPTYVVGGRGYWEGEQVRDAVAYLRALANPRDEEALYGVLASPFCGAGADALILLAEAGRAAPRAGVWAALEQGPPAGLPAEQSERLARFAEFFAAERRAGERLSVEQLLERAIARTGYDLAVLRRAGGRRRLANLRKLMRLAREHERSEGRDLRGFLGWVAGQERAAAREGEAPLESDGLEAIRLMTIHAAKGLEFPVVCVPDLGRALNGWAKRLVIGRDGRVGLGLRMPGGGKAVKALAYEEVAEALAQAELEEEKRLFYVAMTRAEDLLILSGTTDFGRWPAERSGCAPIDWLAPVLLGDPAERLEDPTPRIIDLDLHARLRLVVNTPETLPAEALTPAPVRRRRAAGTRMPAPPAEVAAVEPGHAGPRRMSYSSLQDYGRCGYRYYLRRVLGLPAVDPPPGTPTPPPGGLDPRVRGTIVHRALEELDFEHPAVPDLRALAAGVELSPADIADLAAMVDAFAASSLRARLAAARRVRREAGFVFALDEGPLVNGFLDVLAEERDRALVVDYKSDRLEGADTATLVDRDYGTQRAVYALAALTAGHERVEVAYCFLERPEEIVSSTFTQADVPALQGALRETARGLLAGRFAPTDSPHRDLCGDCPGRRALCSHPENRTLAPLQDASAGTFSGSTGPS